MAKPGRNDPCPCGSGNKYKKCCLPNDEAAQMPPERSDDDLSASAARFKSALAAIVAGAGADGDEDGDALMDASNAVVDLVRAGKLDEAEAAARALLARYPDVHDGWDRLGMVHEARGANTEAADCYRKVVEFLDQNPDYSEPGFRASFAERIAKLTPPPAT